MTKWDTIQADVADMYVGLNELMAWEDSQQDLLVMQLDDLDENGIDELTLDWED